MWKCHKNLQKRTNAVFGIKETEAAKIHLKADSLFEFERDWSPITILDWTGNYKKGTFRLNYTRISKKKGGTSFGMGLLTGGLLGGSVSLLIK